MSEHETATPSDPRAPRPTAEVPASPTAPTAPRPAVAGTPATPPPLQEPGRGAEGPSPAEVPTRRDRAGTEPPEGRNPRSGDAAASPSSSTSEAAGLAEPGVADGGEAGGGASPRNRRRRRSRGGRGRGRGGDRPTGEAGAESDEAVTGGSAATEAPKPAGPSRAAGIEPETPSGAGTPRPPGPPSPPPKPKIGDSRPAPPSVSRPPAAAAPAGRSNGAGTGAAGDPGPGDESTGKRRRRRRRGGGGSGGSGGSGEPAAAAGGGERKGPSRPQPAQAVVGGLAPGEAAAALAALDESDGALTRERALGRYLMVVHVQPEATQIAVLEGRSLVQHVVSRPQNDTTEIDGNIYLARVQNVLPGMEAAFIDIGTPKNAVLYRSDVRFDKEDVEGDIKKDEVRIEQVLKGGQTIICQVTKNPIAHKGARLTQDVSLPGRFVVLVPNSDTYGISKRLPDDERKRLRRILDSVKPKHHGIIVRTAAEGCDADELRRDVARLVGQWEQIEQLAEAAKAPALLYREPDIAVRFIREELTKEFRGVVIDDPKLYEEVRSYVASINPELAGRIELFDTTADPLPLFERHHVHEQLHKAVDRKVWLPSGGSLIIERTEALTVIDVNTGKNVGKSNLEETVFRNNLEAATEVARQLRLRDIGGIIVIDFIDMEIKENRAKVAAAFRQALARDKTRVQVFDISELGLVEMTRKRVSEGLVESLSDTCPVCEGNGYVLDKSLLG